MTTATFEVALAIGLLILVAVRGRRVQPLW